MGSALELGNCSWPSEKPLMHRWSLLLCWTVLRGCLWPFWVSGIPGGVPGLWDCITVIPFEYFKDWKSGSGIASGRRWWQSLRSDGSGNYYRGLAGSLHRNSDEHMWSAWQSQQCWQEKWSGCRQPHCVTLGTMPKSSETPYLGFQTI